MGSLPGVGRKWDLASIRVGSPRNAAAPCEKLGKPEHFLPAFPELKLQVPARESFRRLVACPRSATRRGGGKGSTLDAVRINDDEFPALATLAETLELAELEWLLGLAWMHAPWEPASLAFARSAPRDTH